MCKYSIKLSGTMAHRAPNIQDSGNIGDVQNFVHSPVGLTLPCEAGSRVFQFVTNFTTPYFLTSGQCHLFNVNDLSETANWASKCIDPFLGLSARLSFSAFLRVGNVVRSPPAQCEWRYRKPLSDLAQSPYSSMPGMLLNIYFDLL